MRLIGLTIQGHTGTMNLERHNKAILLINRTPLPSGELIHDHEDAGICAQKIALKIGYDGRDDIAQLETFINIMRQI